MCVEGTPTSSLTLTCKTTGLNPKVCFTCAQAPTPPTVTQAPAQPSPTFPPAPKCDSAATAACRDGSDAIPAYCETQGCPSNARSTDTGCIVNNGVASMTCVYNGIPCFLCGSNRPSPSPPSPTVPSMGSLVSPTLATFFVALLCSFGLLV